MEYKAEVVELLRITKELNNKMKESIIENNFLDCELSDYVEVIIDLVGVPRDTTLETEPGEEDYFCRDRFYQVTYDYVLDYESNDYTAEETYDMLRSLKEGLCDEN